MDLRPPSHRPAPKLSVYERATPEQLPKLFLKPTKEIDPKLWKAPRPEMAPGIGMIAVPQKISDVIICKLFGMSNCQNLRVRVNEEDLGAVPVPIQPGDRVAIMSYHYESCNGVQPGAITNNFIVIRHWLTSPPMVTFQKQMKMLFENNRFTDFTLIARDGQKIRLHKAVLVAMSDFMAAALISEDDSDSPATSYAMNDVSYTTLKIIVDYAYGEDIAGGLVQQHVEELYHAAHHYKIVDLVALATDAMQSKVSVENVLRRFRLAYVHEDVETQAILGSFIGAHAEEIKDTGEWLTVLTDIGMVRDLLVAVAEILTNKREVKRPQAKLSGSSVL